MADSAMIDKNVLEVINKNKPSEVAITKTITLKSIDKERQATSKTAKPKKITPKHQQIQQVSVIKIKKSKKKKAAPTASVVKGMQQLTSVIKRMMALFQDMRREEKAEHEKLLKRFDELEDQNQKLAKGVLAVADMVRDQTTTSDSIQAKLEEVYTLVKKSEEAVAVASVQAQIKSKPIMRDDLSLPGNKSFSSFPSLSSSTSSPFSSDRLPERKPLFLDRMPKFSGPLPQPLQMGGSRQQQMPPLQPFQSQQAQTVSGASNMSSAQYPLDANFPKPIKAAKAPPVPFAMSMEPAEELRQQGQAKRSEDDNQEQEEQRPQQLP